MAIPAYKLTPQEVLRIRHCWQNWGFSIRGLARTLDMSEDNTSKMVYRTTYQQIERSDHRYFNSVEEGTKWVVGLAEELAKAKQDGHRERRKDKVRQEWESFMVKKDAADRAREEIEWQLFFEANPEVL